MSNTHGLKTETTLLLITLLLLSLVAGSITLTPTSAQSPKPKLKLIERGQYWERYYNPERGTYVMRIYADAQYVKNPYTGEWIPYLWEYCRSSEPCLYRVWIPHASFEVNRNGSITVYDVNRTKTIFLERFLIHYQRETRFGVKIPVYETFRGFHHMIEEHGNETLIKLVYTYPSGTLTVKISLHRGAHYAKTLHFKPLDPDLRYSIILERGLPKTDLRLKIGHRLISLKNILNEETLPGNLTRLDLKHGKRLLARDVFPRPELLKSIKLLLGRIYYRFGEFMGEARFRDPTTTISPPTDDAYVNGYYSSTDYNYGSESFLEISDRSGYTRRIFIRFDLSSIPSGVVITSAKVRLYYYDYDINNPVGKQTDIHRVLGSWSEDTITWNNKPDIASTATSSTNMPSSYGWVEWTVTDDVQGMIDGDYDNYGWCIKFHTEGLAYEDCSSAYFYSKEYDGYDPELYVEYIPVLTVNLVLVNKNTALETNDYFEATYTYRGSQHTAQLVNGTNTLTIDNNTWVYVEQFSYLSNSTHRWAMNSTFNETFTENATRILYYWFQVKIIIQVDTAHGTDLNSSNYVQALYQNFSQNALTSELYDGTSVSVWADNGTVLEVNETSSASSSTHRWATPDNTQTITQNGTYTFNYYEQYHVTVSVTKADPDFVSTDADNYFTATGTQFGSTVTLSSLYEGNPITKWLDAQTTLTIDSTSTGSNENEIWDIVDTSWTVDSTSHTFYYWDHLKISLYPQISKPYTQSLTSDNYATVTYTSYGSNFTAHVWINDTTPYVWADRGGNVYWSSATSASTSVHRWATPGPVTLEGIDSPSASQAIYYEQYKVTWHLVKAHQNFSDTTSSNYFNASGQQFNGTLTLTGLYTGRDLSDWVDYKSTIGISSLSSASSSNHKWVSGGESYTVTTGGTYQFTYYEYVKQYVGKKILDADGDDDIKDGISLIIIQNMWNSSTIQLEPGDSGWFYYNITNRVYRVKWRGIWIDLRTNQTWNPTTPNYRYNFTVPDVWLLGDSEIEWYLKSSSGSEVYTWVWGENTETLVVIQGKNRGDEVYFYYGDYGKSPQYVYVDGGLVENYALEEDPDLQLMHIPFPAERVDLDFSGESRKAETSVTQLTGMVQQILRQLDMIRIGMLSFVNITQPTGPTIRIPTIDFSKLTSHIYAWIDTYSPIKAALLIPLLMFLGSFLTLYAIARKLGLKRPEHPPTGQGETIVVVRTERPSLQSILARSAATSIAAALITYLILPRIFPAHFGQPGPLQLTIVAMVLASILVAFIAWLAAGRREVYRGSRR